MRPLPVVPAARCGLFTTSEAAEIGWTRSALRHAEHRGVVTRIRRDTWAEALDPALPASADLTRARLSIAAALGARGTLVSHLAAATALELPTWAPEPRPCVTVVGRERITLDGVHTHRSGAMTATRRGDVVLTGPARTIVDIAREFGPEAALVTADAALQARCVTMAELRAATLRCRGPGADRARLLPALVDPLAESPLESRSRWQFRVHGIDPPRSQAMLFTSGGVFLGRCDFFWEEGVVGEVDGSMKYDEPDARAREKWRQESFERTGLLLVRWGARELRGFRVTAGLIRDRRARASRPDWPRDWLAPPPPDYDV